MICLISLKNQLLVFQVYFTGHGKSNTKQLAENHFFMLYHSDAFGFYLGKNLQQFLGSYACFFRNHLQIWQVF